jgi:hypothetical protein
MARFLEIFEAKKLTSMSRQEDRSIVIYIGFERRNPGNNPEWEMPLQEQETLNQGYIRS